MIVGSVDQVLHGVGGGREGRQENLQNRIQLGFFQMSVSERGRGFKVFHLQAPSSRMN